MSVFAEFLAKILKEFLRNVAITIPCVTIKKQG